LSGQRLKEDQEMLAGVRIIAIVLIFLTIVYICLSFYIRSVQRQKFQTAWELQGRPGTCETYIRQELDKQEKAVRCKLIFGVYVIPLTFIAALIYFTNFA